MTSRRSRNMRRLLSTAVAIAATMAPAAAYAQSTPPKPAPQTLRKHQFNIPAQKLSSALLEFSRQSNILILFSPDIVRGKRSNELKTFASSADALQDLIKGSGLHAVPIGNGFRITDGSPANDRLNVAKGGKESKIYDNQNVDKDLPDILITGTKSNGSLNLDIPRTRDDAQPYVVFTQKQIERSGATNLDDFFRNQLGSNNSATTGSQQNRTGGLSSINLRGLGIDGTLILVDGRRLAIPNDGSGALTQSAINQIPLSSIDRIEILASSASGIYGSNAVGGVINIITKRDYKGLEFNQYLGISSRGDAAQMRLSINGSLPLEGGKTRVTYNLSWQRNDPLYIDQRDFSAKARALALANNPVYFASNHLLLGTTANISAPSGQVLKLKPQYGGTSLGSNVTFVPVGFRGIALDGVAGLIANAGKQSTGIPDTSQSFLLGPGGRSTLLSGSTNYNADVSVRREFNNWLTVYVDGGYSRFEAESTRPKFSGLYTLKANAANNPFTTDVSVVLPTYGLDVKSTSVNENWSVYGGAIIKLPYGWSADLDASFNWQTFSGFSGANGFDVPTNAGLVNGSIDVLQDIRRYQLGFLPDPAFDAKLPPSYQRTFTVKLAGPLPIRLWGGKPVATLNYSNDRQSLGDFTSFTQPGGSDQSQINYFPARSQTANGLYGELRIPLIGKDNHVPLIRELELQIAGRRDWYAATGADTFSNCVRHSGPLTSADFALPCPTTPTKFATSRNASTNPTYAIKWSPIRDITFRGSYATGYQAPYLNQLVGSAGLFTAQQLAIFAGGVVLDPTAGYQPVSAKDPARGGELIGIPLGFLNVIPATLGGNTNVKPQTSKSYSAGVILKPSFLDGLRISVDWTRIVRRNLYFSPSNLLSPVTALDQRQFEDFLAEHPERFTRAAPAAGDPFPVGKITSVDVSEANQAFQEVRALDFAVNYQKSFGQNAITFDASATYAYKSLNQLTARSPITDSTDLINTSFSQNGGAVGGNDFKANATVVYSTPAWSFGARVTYFSGFWLNGDHSPSIFLLKSRVPGQAYVDVFGSVKLLKRAELRIGVNNVLDKEPPILPEDINGYSRVGDPRKANFYANLKVRF